MNQETRHSQSARSTTVLQYKCVHTKKKSLKQKLEDIKEVIKISHNAE